MILRSIALALLTLAVVGCTTPQTDALIKAPGTLPLRANVSDVPFFPQEDFYCGPAALATVLNWSGLSTDPETVAAHIYTPSLQGTLQKDILAGARRAGRLAVPVSSLRDLMGEIAAGHPVLVFQNLSFDWYPQWHYAVAVAYDLERNQITLRSGRDAQRMTTLTTFERTWQRGGNWAVLILRPDDLPGNAKPDAISRATSGLERAGRLQEAAAAYSAMLSRWPDNYAALMGLGNVHYKMGDLQPSKRAFRRAITAQPDRAEAWNNLAYVLAAEGRREEAIRAAQKAISLSNDMEGPYRDTLRDVSKI